MEADERELTEHEAAAASALDVVVVHMYAEHEVIAPVHGYRAADLAELRRVRRLMDDLGLDHPAIEIVLRMRQRMLRAQAEVRRLERELRAARPAADATPWSEAEWTEVEDRAGAGRNE